MQTTTSGIVLRKVAYSGSSVIAMIYTRKHGAMSFIIRGVGRKKSGIRPAALEYLSQVEISFDYREKIQLQTLFAISLAPSDNLHVNHPAFAPVSLFLAEVLYKTLREESPDEDLYDFIASSLAYFADSEYTPNFHIIFLMKLSRFFGFFPSGRPGDSIPYFDMQNGMYVSSKNATLHTLDKSSSNLFYQLSEVEFGQPLKFNPKERREILARLIEYYQLHLEGMGEIKSLSVLTEVFSS